MKKSSRGVNMQQKDTITLYIERLVPYAKEVMREHCKRVYTNSTEVLESPKVETEKAAS